MKLSIAALLAATASARPMAVEAEGEVKRDGVGFYFLESFGVGKARGALAPMVGNAIHARLGAGARWRFLALEPWIATDMQWDRDGAWRGFVGGVPSDGRADLEYYGLDVKLIAPVYRGRNGEQLEGYVRGGARLVGGTGALEGHTGRGFGAAAGFQLVGKVRALGFLWTPLFFAKRGPKVTGALFIEQGWELVALRRDGDRIAAPVGHVGVGFGVGSSF